jgi:hypothetical protein
MEWNRGPGQTQPANQPVSQTSAAAHNPGTHKTKSSMVNLRIVSVLLLFCITILLVALVSFIAFGGPTSQSKYVDKTKMQAVFLNGGQVYFGKITNSNDRFMRVADIYYLRVNQQVQPDGSTSTANQDVSLVKLGCELHGPQDSMVLNQDQIIFWENLKDDGQVAKAVAQFQKDNPNGQKCTTPTTSTTTPAATTPAATTPAATTPAATTKKP